MTRPQPAPPASDAPASTPRAALVAVVRADAMESGAESLVRNLEFASAVVACTGDADLASALREAGVDHVIEESLTDLEAPLEPCPPSLRAVLDGFGRRAWILALEGDERVSATLREALSALPAADGEPIRAYRVPVTRFVCGGYLRHGGWESREPRVFLRDGGGTARAPSGRDSGELDAPLVHLGHRRIDERLRWINARTDLVGDVVARPPGVLATLTAPLRRFVDVYGRRRGFRDGIPGLIAAVLASFETFLRGLKEWERRHGRSD